MSDRAEERRQRKISMAKQFAAGGFVDHAVKAYCDAQEPRRAAEILVAADRVFDAVRLMLGTFDHDPEALATSVGKTRARALFTAALMIRSGDERRASGIMRAIGELSPEEKKRFESDAVLNRAPVERKRNVRVSQSAMRAADTLSLLTRAAATGRLPSQNPPGPLTGPPRPARRTGPPSGPPSVHGSTPRSHSRSTPAPQQERDVPTVRPPPSHPSQSPPRSVRRPSSPRLDAVSASAVRQRHRQRAPSSSGVELRQRETPVPGRPSTGDPTGDPITVRPPPMTTPADSREDKIARADAAHADGLYERALPLYLEAEHHLGAGACLRALRQHPAALERLRMVDPRGPDYRGACAELIHAAMGLGQLDPATSAYVRAFESTPPAGPEELGAALALAELLFASGDRDRARRCVDKVVAVDPENANAQLLMLSWALE